MHTDSSSRHPSLLPFIHPSIHRLSYPPLRQLIKHPSIHVSTNQQSIHAVSHSHLSSISLTPPFLRLSIYSPSRLPLPQLMSQASIHLYSIHPPTQTDNHTIHPSFPSSVYISLHRPVRRSFRPPLQPAITLPSKAPFLLDLLLTASQKRLPSSPSPHSHSPSISAASPTAHIVLCYRPPSYRFRPLIHSLLR